jgi:hypothetical protein
MVRLLLCLRPLRYRFAQPRRQKHRRGGLAVQSLLEAKALLARVS